MNPRPERAKPESAPDVSPTRHPLLLDALRLLPGIGPLCERQRLGEAKYRASRSSSFSVDFNGVILKLAQLQELFIHDKQGRPHVSPAGAKLLIHLHKERAFAALEERRVTGNLEVLARYAEGLARVIDLNYWRGETRKPRHRPEEAARAQARDARDVEAENRSGPRLPDAAVLIHRLV